MFKRYILLLATLGIFTTTLEGCFMQKNKCDTCPGIVRKKKVRRTNKGSI